MHFARLDLQIDAAEDLAGAALDRTGVEVVDPEQLAHRGEVYFPYPRSGNLPTTDLAVGTVAAWRPGSCT